MPIPFLTAIGLGLRRAGEVLRGAAARSVESTTKAARTIYGAVRGAVSRGVGLERIRKIPERTGVHVPTEVVDKIAIAEKRRREPAQRLKFLRRDRRPNPDRLPFALTPIARAYSFIVRVTGQDKDTGEEVERWLTVSTDELLTREEIEDTAASFVNLGVSAQGIINPSFQVSEGMKSPYNGGFQG